MPFGSTPKRTSGSGLRSLWPWDQAASDLVVADKDALLSRSSAAANTRTTFHASDMAFISHQEVRSVMRRCWRGIPTRPNAVTGWVQHQFGAIPALSGTLTA